MKRSVSVKEISAVAEILADPENQNRSAEQMAELAISALDDVRARTHRLAVVGQIAFPEAPEIVHTAILGPFSSRGILDSQGKFLKAVAGPSRARQAGQDLAWDPRLRTGRGRFMLAPAFMSARSAWEFYRRPEPPDPRLVRIGQAIARWRPGLWAEEVNPAPVCHCGIREREHQTSAGPAPTGPCPVHGRGER